MIAASRSEEVRSCFVNSSIRLRSAVSIALSEIKVVSSNVTKIGVSGVSPLRMTRNMI